MDNMVTELLALTVMQVERAMEGVRMKRSQNQLDALTAMQVNQQMVFREQCVLNAVLGHIQIREMRHVVIAMRAIGVWQVQRQHRVVVSALQVTTVAFLRRQQLKQSVASVATAHRAQVLQHHALRATLALQQITRYRHVMALVQLLVITALPVAPTRQERSVMLAPSAQRHRR